MLVSNEYHKIGLFALAILHFFKLNYYHWNPRYKSLEITKN